MSLNAFEAHTQMVGQLQVESGFQQSVLYASKRIPALVSPFRNDPVLTLNGYETNVVSSVLIQKSVVPDGITFTATTGHPISVTDPFGVEHSCRITAIEDLFTEWRLTVADF